MRAPPGSADDPLRGLAADRTLTGQSSGASAAPDQCHRPLKQAEGGLEIAQRRRRVVDFLAAGDFLEPPGRAITATTPLFFSMPTALIGKRTDPKMSAARYLSECLHRKNVISEYCLETALVTGVVIHAWCPCWHEARIGASHL